MPIFFEWYVNFKIDRDFKIIGITHYATPCRLIWYFYEIFELCSSTEIKANGDTEILGKMV